MPGGRPAKYDWDDKKDICYRLFVEQKQSPNEIVKYFTNHFGVDESEIPSARLFRRQFNKIWKFPPRKPRLTPEEKVVVVDRIKQLWEQNLSVKAIRESLEEEGWELGVNEFEWLRKKNGCLRRSKESGSYGGKKRKQDPQEDQKDGASVFDGQGLGAMDSLAGGKTDALLALQQYRPGLTPQEQARRAQRRAQVQLESDEALQTRKRRRRIRGYGHLPADEPGLEPRYRSETTLDECKAFLQLTNELYTELRDEFEQICLETGIERKKTVVENGMWQASKDRLVVGNMHLSAVMHPLQGDLEKKTMALDLICADVTKRIRSGRKRMSLAEANNSLGLNPSASKELRRTFYDILGRDEYTTRLACGDEHWAELRAEWIATSPVLQQAVAEEQISPPGVKAIDVLCRDATKRYNDDKIRQDPSRKQYTQNMYGPGPGSCKANKKRETPNGPPKITSTAPPKKRGPKPAKSAISDVNLDPALYALEPPLAVDFRLGLETQLVGNHPRIWSGNLHARNMQALCEAATSKAGAAQVTSIQGVLVNEDGSEETYHVLGIEELDVYLEASGNKATFLVVLAGGYA